jgi:alpha-N-acetylglucosaminidase
MRPTLKALLLALPFAAATAVASPSEDAARQLAERVVPALAGQLRFEEIPRDAGRDVFEIESQGGMVVLRGDNGVAMASALNRYLEEFCRCEISWDCGNQLAVPNPAPAVPGKVRVVSPYRFRYAYNYCTHGYTMAWWDWPRWQHELDFLALKGVNLGLVIEGQEQVWIDALERFGYTNADVRKWLCLPSHQPWQYMSNMEDYGGPLSQPLVDRRLALGRSITARMRELGMEPVLQGYYGIVPSDFKARFPAAKIHAQGIWGGLKRPDMLDPLDPMFARMGAAFYEAQSRLYGGAPGFLAADPFHEGGSTEGIDLAACGKAIYGAMDRSRPGVTWVLQSWLDNPRQPMIDALDKSRILVLDLFCESTEHWRTRDQFGRTPWLWCSINNFGGNIGLGGKLDLLRTEPAAALAEAGPGKGSMVGIGALMEGSETQPMLWEMFLGNSWRSEAPDFGPWLEDYATRRYGRADPHATRVLGILAETVYGKNGSLANSVLCARPSLEPYPKADFWGTTKPAYDTTRLVAAWRELLDAAPGCDKSDGYRYDAVDLGRQVLSDLVMRYHHAVLDAYARRDAAELARLRPRMLGLIRDIDALLGTRREFLLGAWLADARSYGATPEESDRCEQDSRELLTTWTSEDGVTADYANREWNGLVGTFYLARWQTWLDALGASMAAGRPVDLQAVLGRIRDSDMAWTRSHDGYPSEPSGDPVGMSRRLFERYSADAESPELDADFAKDFLHGANPDRALTLINPPAWGRVVGPDTTGSLGVYPSSAQEFVFHLDLAHLLPEHRYILTLNGNPQRAGNEFLPNPVPGNPKERYYDFFIATTDDSGSYSGDFAVHLHPGDYDIRFYVKDTADFKIVLYHDFFETKVR